MSIGVANNLREARALIETPETWTRDEAALDAGGEPTDPDDEDAVCWCARGALEAVGCCVLFGGETEEDDGNGMDLAEWSCLNEEAQRLGYSSIEELNDATGHVEVLRMFDGAIARAEAS